MVCCILLLYQEKMVTTRQAVADKVTRVNLDTIMGDDVHEEHSIAQAAQDEGESTYNSEYNGEDLSSRRDQVSIEEITYLEDEEMFI